MDPSIQPYRPQISPIRMDLSHRSRRKPLETAQPPDAAGPQEAAQVNHRLKQQEHFMESDRKRLHTH